MKKGTLIAVAVFGMLLLVVLLTRERQVSVGVRKLELPALDKDKVVGIELSGAKTASLKKDAGGWTVADPGKPDQKHPADEQQITAALDAYKELRVQDLISDKAEKLPEYELEDAKALKVKILNQGGPAVEVVLGKAAKNGGVYLREPKNNAAYTAQGRFQWMIRKDLNAWRKRSFFTAKLDDLEEVSVHPKEGDSYVLIKGDGGGWKLKDQSKLPESFRFDPSAAQGLVQQFTNLRAQDFIDSPGSDESQGLDGPHTFLEAKFKDGKAIKLHLGKEEAKENATKAVVARLEGDPQVYLLPSYTATVLSKRATDLRDLTLLSFDPQKVTKVFLVSSGKKTVLAKDGDAWKVIEPKKMPRGFEFDPAQVASQLNILRGLRATRVIEGKVEPAQSGLAKPTTAVDLSLEGGSHQLLRFGREAKKGDQGQEVYVKGSADGLTYAIYEGARARFDSGIELFKKPPAPAPNMSAGGIRGLESLPPDVRAKIEAQLRQQQHQ
jgi:hypothetical protein